MNQDLQQPNITQLDFLLHNRAAFAQAYPMVELTFLDGDEKVLARRRLKPADYLKQKNELVNGLASNREATVQLRLDTGELKPSGYKLFLF